MIKTYNRSPVSFGKPAQNADNIKHFNTYKFKGLIDNKNFLNIEQDSFADCSNIYVDSEDVLRSRPSLKEQKVIINLDNRYTTLANIVDVKAFSDVIVYQSENQGTYYLTFVNEDFEEHLQVECEKDIKLVLADKRIFVFAKNSFNYYDTDTNQYLDAEKYIYKPVTKYYVDNIATDEKGQSPNILTNSDVYSYIYTNVINGDYSTLIGKNTSIVIDDEVFEFTFAENNNYVLVDKFTISNKLTNTQSDTEPNVYGIGGKNYLMLSVSDNNVFVASEPYLISEEDGCKEYSYKHYYSVDGLLYYKLKDLEESISEAKVSKNGFYAVTMTERGPYIISLLDTLGGVDGEYKYPDWTDLLTYLNYDGSRDFNTGETAVDFVGKVSLKHSTVLNFDIINDENFVITYGISPIDDIALYTPLFYGNNEIYTFYKTYTKLKCLYCINKQFDSRLVSSVSPKTKNLKNNETATITLNGTEVGGRLDITDCEIIPNDDETAYVTFNYAIYFGTNLLVSSVFQGTMQNNEYIIVSYSNPNISGPGTYNKPTSNIFGVRLINLSTEPTITITAGYYVNDDATYVIYGLNSDYIETHENMNIILNGYKPNVKLDILEHSYSIMVNCYGVAYNPSYNNGEYLQASTALIFKDSSKESTHVNVWNRPITTVYTENIKLVTSSSSFGRYQLLPLYYNSPLSDGIFTKIHVDSNGIYSIYNVMSNTSAYYNVVVIRSTNNGYSIFSNYKELNDNSIENRFVFSNEANYLLSSKKLYSFKYEITNSSIDIKTLNELDLIKTGYPLNVNEQNGLLQDIMYYTINDNNIATIYKTSEKVELKVENERDTNYLLPDYVSQLENFYFAEKEKLYINTKRVDRYNKFMWYFPENQRQIYNYNITNLHPISTTEMAVFFKDEIRYIVYDENVDNYRDFKTRLDIGCKPGSDVITTYDSKYTIFVTERGLVAMSYQEFISSTEQALSYLSDNIYDAFVKYIDGGEIKLHKFGFWLFVYRQDKNNGFLFDLRSNSWWPITLFNNVTKLYNYDGKLYVLSENNILKPDKSDIDYYDFVNGEVKIIPWNILSQKLYLGSANFNKLVFNMTFASVHDLQLLEQANIPITETSFKLQVRNYRKVITGTIGSDSSTIVNYNVNSARTYVQKMNYGNITEFEYLLSYDTENEYQIPLSLSCISVKYKIGGPVR